MKSFPMVRLALLVVVPSIGHTETVTIRAPVDGLVVTVSEVGNRFGDGRRDSEVVRIDPSLMRQQVEIDSSRLEIAKERLTKARELFAAESASSEKSDVAGEKVLAVTNWRRDRDRDFILIPPKGRCQSGCLSPNDTEGLVTNLNDAVDAEIRIGEARRKSLLENLKGQIALADKELQVVEKTLELGRAIIELGHVPCPSGCVVAKRWVLAGQWVSKGDPLVDVRVGKP